MRSPFDPITATPDEIAASRPGDDLVPHRDVVMDRAATLDAAPEQVWPWIAQLGKARAGWYLPRSVERFVPRRHRALRAVGPRWQGLAVGDLIPDYGGRDETFEVAIVDEPQTLVYTSQRGRVSVSWSITLAALDRGTRIHFRLVLGPVKHRWLAEGPGDLFDAVTIAGMIAGLRERLAES